MEEKREEEGSSGGRKSKMSVRGTNIALRIHLTPFVGISELPSGGSGYVRETGRSEVGE